MDALYNFANELWPYAMGFMILMVVLRGTVFIVSLIQISIRTWKTLKTDFKYRYSNGIKKKLGYLPLIFLMGFRSFLPGHSYLTSKPVYVMHRIVFHVALFICVFCLSYHLYTWGDSLPNWILVCLPYIEISDDIIEYTSLFIIFSTLYMTAKRFLFARLRQSSGVFDFILSFVILVPFTSGYFAMTGLETSIEFIDNHLYTIHVFSGEIFILVASVLFCKTIINADQCVSCLACVNNCPTQALYVKDAGGDRHIFYTAEKCIHCGTCMKVCDDRASALRHVTGIPFPGRSKILCSSKMAACESCKTLFVPVKQLIKLKQSNMNYDIGDCPDCRQFLHAQTQKELLPQE